MGLRVIGGMLRGRRILTRELPGLRPTTDRVRESLFNILEARIGLEDLSTLDLCAGSGALGIEALSRGAARCDFVEKSRRTAELIDRNVKELGLEDRSRVIVDDALRYLKRTEKKYDLILSDPPYRAAFLNDLVAEAPGALASEGYVLLEHAPGFRLPPAPLLESVLSRTFGNTSVTLLRRIS